ncbi:ATP-binding protein [Acidiphilium sp.]|uniref:ATP-binding protein n=1 Tax=Acidiphilium sp. TaxID=527 RepID=UPI00258786B2|nr:ATP-binding protein [Acidiphilium sp.]
MSRLSRLVPATLFGQTVLVLLAGLVFSALLGISILALNQTAVVRTIGAFAASQRIVNLTSLIDNVPPNWRDRLITAASDETLEITLSAHRPAWAEVQAKGERARTIRAFLASRLPPELATTLRVAVEAAPLRTRTVSYGMMSHGMMQPGIMGMMGPSSLRGMAMMNGRGMGGMVFWRRMRATVQLPSGQWLAFAVALPPSGFGLSWPFLAALIAMAMVVVPSSIWAVRRVTAPLRTLAAAAERLGRDVAAPPLAELGSMETRQAAHAFNLMQARLRQLVQSRTRMLAALSHDLRTPLTLLRLRLEDVQEVEERERMLATIASMNEIIDATLAFARDDATIEPARRIDLAALLLAIVDDLADAGLKVVMTLAEPVAIICQPAALRRALINLIDNAVKYGGSAEVTITSSQHTVTVMIDDHGPGIAEPELSKVFEPFYRIEASRSRETGGSGLGLAIALAVVEAQGGTLRLSNRPSGGLSAQVTLQRR